MTTQAPLDPLLAFLDANSFILDGFGCFVSLSPDGKTIYECSAMADGSPERNEGDARHMNWREVTAPAPSSLLKKCLTGMVSWDIPADLKRRVLP